MDKIIAGQRDMVDAMCTRTYGDESGYVEAVLLANPGLAALGPIPPMGTVVKMPDIQIESDTPVVTLWD